jgi:hypothetical protein
VFGLDRDAGLLAVFVVAPGGPAQPKLAGGRAKGGGKRGRKPPETLETILGRSATRVPSSYLIQVQLRNQLGAVDSATLGRS